MKNLKNVFISKSKEKFGDKFDYSKVNYIKCNIPIILICKEHGEFTITPRGHLNSNTGCTECSKHIKRKPKILINGVDRKQLKEYRIWKCLRNRANNPNRKDSKYYYQKGIKVCPEWDSFEQFYSDMGNCPEGMTIDRINPNGDYCRENCRWATMQTQSENRGEFNKVFTYNGESRVLKDWARVFNIKYTTLYNRIYRSGKSFEEAIQIDPFNKLILYNNESHTLKEWCELKNMEYNVVRTRLNKHKWTFEEAINTPKGSRRKK